MPDTLAPPPADPVEQIPDPETVKSMLAESVRRATLLRSLLRVAVRKAKYPAEQSQGRAARD